MASALCSRAMRAQGMSAGTSEKRVWYSARRLSFSGRLMGIVLVEVSCGAVAWKRLWEW